jgi:hypothetical protein
LFLYLFLLHELGRRAVIADVFAEDRDGEASIDVRRADFIHRTVEHKIVALWAKAYCMLLSNENEREYVAILRDINPHIKFAVEHSTITFF